MTTPALKSGDISGDGVSIIASSTVVVFLAVGAVALRFWARGMNSRYGADDWTILLGLFLVSCLYSTSVAINTVGFGGFQQSELTTSQLERSLVVRPMSLLLGSIAIHCRVDQDTSYSTSTIYSMPSPYQPSNVPYYYSIDASSRSPPSGG